ncbi:ABC transporter permease [Zeimonas arvi]|uniref:ABC transporter permease n=2 Tax=Zeimonas arvi TaxID=2498847 RepID=A0A5C8P5L4_9BURK|nr:ABC transporter permease [Zeimonas arvi]
MDRYLTRLRMALAFLREPQRVLMVCLTVALGTIALILADGFIDRTMFVFREDIIRAHFAHIQVLPAEADGRIGTEARGGDTRSLLERELASDPGAVVAARLSFAGLVSFGERTVGFVGEGVEPDKEVALSKAVRLSSGSQITGSGNEVLLGEGLARSIGASVGDRITLLTNVRGGGVNAIEAVVVGLFHTATKAYDDRALRLSIAAAQQLTRSSGVSRLMILLSDTDAAAATALRLREVLTGEGVQVKVWSELADFYNKTVDLFSRQLSFVRTVILAIVLLAASNAMARNVLEQQREIGTMMALGARRATVAGKFVAEALAMGVVGGLVGVVVGGAIARAVTWIGIPMPPPPGNAHGFVGGVSFSLATASLAFLSIVAICVIAALLPALRASRANIVDALRADR